MLDDLLDLVAVVMRLIRHPNAYSAARLHFFVFGAILIFIFVPLLTSLVFLFLVLGLGSGLSLSFALSLSVGYRRLVLGGGELIIAAIARLETLDPRRYMADRLVVRNGWSYDVSVAACYGSRCTHA